MVQGSCGGRQARYAICILFTISKHFKMKKSPPRFIDQTWIDLLDPISVTLWTTRLAIPETELRHLVRNLGGDAQAVEQYLARRKMFPKTSSN